MLLSQLLPPSVTASSKPEQGSSSAASFSHLAKTQHREGLVCLLSLNTQITDKFQQLIQLRGKLLSNMLHLQFSVQKPFRDKSLANHRFVSNTLFQIMQVNHQAC